MLYDVRCNFSNLFVALCGRYEKFITASCVQLSLVMKSHRVQSWAGFSKYYSHISWLSQIGKSFSSLFTIEMCLLGYNNSSCKSYWSNGTIRVSKVPWTIYGTHVFGNYFYRHFICREFLVATQMALFTT